ncbi:MAG: precorrin-6A/cobalt-precorrin-6A reductase [Clostridia bacterium]|nr:precorrin-6A/cobalt-precorrin-6A reductase [Clostridia bacterium]
MILVLAGTSEGREMIAALREQGWQVVATALTPYGAELARAAGAMESLCGPLSEGDLLSLLQNRPFAAVVDCTHPFATAVTDMSKRVCAKLGISYYRYSRPAAKLPVHPLVKPVKDWEEAVGVVASLGGRTIFLTIGTRHLATFVHSPRLQGKRLVVRVLPEVDSLAHCRTLGLLPRDIVALQGPCSRELNLALYRQYGAEIVVTKEDGAAGGLEEKVAAALELSLPVVVVGRPPEEGGMSKEEILAALTLNPIP